MFKLPNLLASRTGRLSGFFGLYVCEGLPQGFTGTAVALEFKRMGMTGAAIGAFAATIMLPWTWKWLMGPVVDNFHLARFGRRKQWILLAQAGMLLTLLASLFLFPQVETGPDGTKVFTGLALFSGMLLAHNIFAASQDVAIDALACETLGEHERGLANGLMFAGAQAGAAIGGSGVLYLKGIAGFSTAAYLVPLMLVAVMAMVLFLIFEKSLAQRAHKRPPAEVFREAGSYLVDTAKVFFGTKRGFLGLLLAVVPTGGMALSLVVSTVLTPTIGMTDDEIASLGLVSSLVFTVCCMTGGFLSDRFGRRLTLAVFSLGTLIPTLWMAWRLHQEGFVTPVGESADGTWPRQEALIHSWWIASIVYSVFQGLMYGIRTALFMDIVEPRIAATQFTACMALLNLVTIYSYAWEGKAITAAADGGWGLSYPTIFLIDAALGTIFVFILPFLKPREKSDVAPEIGATGPEVVQ
ncbi:MAG: MFS transporter [Akkermansiaceae bacterium]|nr:MFS transporter [Akkermansiaceae bacterium]